MTFSSIPFLFFFFPVVMLLYFAVPGKLKNLVLLIGSLAFILWGSPKYLPLILLTAAMFYGCGLAIAKAENPKWKKVWMILSVALSMALLAGFKLLNVSSLNLALPIGISFYTFRGISYTVDIYRGKVAPEKNPLTFAAFLLMFPVMMFGPIVRYTDLAAAFQKREHSWENFYLGLRRFIIGLAKSVILGGNFLEMLKFLQQSNDQSVMFYWVLAFSLLMYVYFDCSGCADQAIGIGRMMGFTFVEDFNYPYTALSAQDFWRRWRMSLASWFKDYMYIPLGGNRVSTGRWVLNTLAIWAFTGLWHGFSITYVLWGLMFAVLLMFEKWVPAFKKLPAFIRRIYLILMVTISFVLFLSPYLATAGQSDLAAAGHYLGSMFGLGGLPLVSADAWFYLRSSAILFIVGIVGVTPVVHNLALRVENTKIGKVLGIVVTVALLLLSVGYLISGGDIGNLYADF